MRQRSWNGNVRELRNTLERAMIFAQSNVLRPEDLFDTLAIRPYARVKDEPWLLSCYTQAKQKALKDFEASYLSEVLSYTGGNISQAARVAGMDRSNFKRLLKRLSVQQIS